MNTPILFLVFNRPATTIRVFETVRQAKPPRLYVAADGPRKDKIGEKEKCEEVRSIIKKVDWSCEVKTLFRDENLGCGRAVSQAITWFFEQEEEGIILEDDILPHPDFFSYCDELLERYRDNGNVGVIAGHNHLYRDLYREESYGFIHMSHIWGWATWRRVWKKYDFNLEKYSEQDFINGLKQNTSNKSVIRYWIWIYKIMKDYKIDTWDYQLFISLTSNCMLSIIPYRNLTKNIGFDERATHTLVSDQREGKIETNPIFPITHPNDIVVDREAVEITNIENHLFLTAIDFIKIRIKDLIKNTYKRIRC